MSGCRIEIRPADGVLARFSNQVAAIGAGKAHQAFKSALNRAGDQTTTVVIRTLVQQTSAPRGIVAASLRKVRHFSQSAGGELSYEIVARGSELPLKIFKPRQFKAGTRAKVWGRTQTFEGAFMGPRPGVIGPRLAGHVFKREGASRLPIGKLYGPSIPKEMVKDATAAAFTERAPVFLETRLRHELGRLLPG